MLTIGLENIKAFSDTKDIELAPITIFVGKNSSGKSSFIRFPVGLSQSLEEIDQSLCLHSNNPNSIDYGNYSDVIHNRKAKSISFKCQYKYAELLSLFPSPTYYRPIKINIPKLKDPDTIIGIKVSYSQFDKHEPASILLQKIEVEINGSFAFSFEKSSKTIYHFIQKQIITDGKLEKVNYEFPLYNRTINNSYDDRFILPINPNRSLIPSVLPGIPDELLMALNHVLERKIYEEESVYINDTDKGKNEEIFNSLDPETQFKLIHMCEGYKQAYYIKKALFNLIHKSFENVHYIGPFRKNPERIYRLEETRKKNVGFHGENTSSILINDFNSSKKIINSVSDWFEKAFSYTVDVEELTIKGTGSGYYQILLSEKDSKIKKNIMDVGFGMSQVLPIVTQVIQSIVMSDPRTRQGRAQRKIENLFVFEQPELHLHPNAQSELAELFAAVANSYYKNNKVLIETHSEHLIRAIQLLIANTESPYHIDPESVKIYYVFSSEETEEKNGSKLVEMKIDKYGQFLEKWPRGFFDKAYSLTSDLMSAINKRIYAEKVNRL